MKRFQTRAFLLALVTFGASCSGRCGASAPAPPPAPASVVALSPEQRQQAYDTDLSAGRRRLNRLQSLVDSFPKDLVDVDALARSVATPEAAFAFVRDQIALEPYTGIMKGAAGTLVSRGGNSIDRALLLATVLARNGVTAKIARGTLQETQAAALLQQIATSPDALTRIARALPKSHSESQLDDRERQSVASIGAKADARARTLRAEAEVSVGVVRASLEAAGLTIGQDRGAAQVKNLQDHFWVQASIGGETVDLDPSLGTAAMNQRLAEPVETFSADRLPEGLYQRLGIRVVVDDLEAGRLLSKDIVRTDARTIDLFNRNIRVIVAPQRITLRQNDYQIEVAMGDAPTVTGVFQIRAASPPQKAAPVGGMLDAFGGESAPVVKPPASGDRAVLGRLAVEITSVAPVLGEVRYRRVILDRLDGDREHPRLQAGLEDDDGIRTLLIQVWDGTIAFGASHPLQMLMCELQTQKAQQTMAEKALAAKYLGQPFTAENLSPAQLPPQLVSFFFYSSLTHHVIATMDAPGVRQYDLRPQLAFFRHGVAVHDWSQARTSRRFQDSIDLVNEPYGFVGAHGEVSMLALKVGVADTALERAFARNGGDFNTVPLIAAAGTQKVAVVATASSRAAAIQQIAVPPAIRSVLLDELARGHTLVAPASMVALNNVRTFGWWSIDPESGVPLGQMELGAGQGTVETSKLGEKIMEMTHIFAKFYGGLLGCYMIEIANQLVPPDGPYTVLHLPLLPKIESGKPLAACVAEKACEAIVEYAMLAATTASIHVKEEAESAIRELVDLVLKTFIAEEAAGFSCEQLEGGHH